MKKEEYRLRLVSNGYIPLPLHGKAPAPPAWQNYREITPAMIQMWTTAWSRAINTGILTNRVPTFDIDVNYPEAAEAVEEMVREFYEEKGRLILRIGKPPKRAFLFRTDKPFKKLSITFAGTPDKLEFLCDGQQVVVDGIHPETGLPYACFGGSLEEIPRSELPEIGEAEAQELMERAAVILEGFGYQRTGRAGKAVNEASASGATSGAGDWNYLVDRIKAGEALHDSLLFLAAKMIGAGMMGGAVVNFLRGLLDGSAAPRDERWQARYDDIPRLVSGAEEKYAPAQGPGVTFSFERSKGANQEQNEPELEEPEEPEQLVPSLFDFGDYDAVDWQQPAGLLGEMTDYVLATSRRPNRPLAVASAVATLSTICGRWLYGPTGTALNLYIVCVGPTAIGKNRPLSAPNEFLMSARLARLHKAAKAHSVSAFEQMLVEAPSCVAVVDEIGSNLLSKVGHKHASTHEAGIKGLLLECWSREDGMGPLITNRHARMKGQQTQVVYSINRPSLTVLGASTAEALWKSIPAGSVRDGFVNRLLLAPAAPRGATQDVEQGVRRVPRIIGEQLKKLVPALEGGNLVETFGKIYDFDLSASTLDAVARWVPWESDAVKVRAMELEEQIIVIGEGNVVQAPLLVRVYEYAIRLAALHAVSRDGVEASVSMADWEWGAAWSIASARSLIAGVGRMADTEYEARENLYREAFSEAKGGWLSRRELLRTVRSVSARERDEVIRNMLEAGLIEQETRKGKTKSSYGWRWLG